MAAIFIAILLVWSSTYAQTYVTNGVKIGEMIATGEAMLRIHSMV